MFNGGGYGGFQGNDGLNYGSPVISVARSQPAELYEQRYPVRMRRFAFRNDSGGAGKYRGGVGAEIELEFVGDEASIAYIQDRGRFGPKGLSGGKDGAKCAISIVHGDDVYISPHLTKDSGIVMHTGALMKQLTPGGGGYGNPFEREIEAVIEDVRNEFVSRESARNEYGVVFKGDTLDVDIEKTAELRRAHNK